MQAALRFLDRGRRVVADFHFSYAGAALDGKHGNRLAVDVQIIQRHTMPLQHFDFDDRIGMFVLAKKFVDSHSRAFAIADAVDNQTWSEDAVATGEDSRC